MKTKVIVIIGPTAVGKTALSVEIAKRFNGEIISGNLFARIVAFFHGRIRVLHTLRINNQESGCFMAPLLAALRNYLIFLMLPQGC